MVLQYSDLNVSVDSNLEYNKGIKAPISRLSFDVFSHIRSFLNDKYISFPIPQTPNKTFTIRLHEFVVLKRPV